MTYERYNAGWWYCFSQGTNLRLYRISNRARVHRRTKLRELRRSRQTIARMGFKVI
jgi:hypothetical protein